MISNKSDDSACAACQTPKPGAKPGAVTAAGFAFGGGQTISSSPFKFGVDNSLNANFSSTSSVKFGAGSSVDTTTKGESSSSAPFVFGSSITDQSSKNDSNQAEGTSKLPATIKFGSFSSSQPSDSGAGEAKKTASPFATFGSSANNHISTDEANKPGFSFGVSSSVDKDKASSAGFAFGTNQVTPEPANQGRFGLHLCKTGLNCSQSTFVASVLTPEKIGRGGGLFQILADRRGAYLKGVLIRGFTV